MLAPLTRPSARALLSPSARVLVAASDPDGGVARAHELPWSDVHWPTFVALTTFERAEFQVSRLLRAAPPGAVPDDVTKTMQDIFRVALFRSAGMAEAAGVAVDALASAGVPALWLKGAALAMQSADDFSVRNMGDLDVLVAPARHAAAVEALVKAGWTDTGPHESYASHHHGAPLVWKGEVRLELHSGLFPPRHPFFADSAEAWIGRGLPVTWGARRVLVLRAAWHLVHASVHWAWSHEGEVGTWQYLHDVARLTAGWGVGDPRWADVISAADAIGARVPVGWGLWSASRLGGASVEDSVVGRLRSKSSLLGGISEREWVLRAFQSPAASPSVTWSRFWWRRAMRGLGADSGCWPWDAGRASAAVPPEMGSAPRRGGVLERWRRHLGRVLRG